MEVLGVIDRIEDNKFVVINFVDIKGTMYLPKEKFNFPIHEGLVIKIKI